MNLNTVTIAPSSPMCRQPECSGPTLDLPAVPLWWLGSREEFKSIHDACVEIHQHDRIMAKEVLTMIITSGLAAFSIASIAGGEVINQGGMGVPITSILLLILTGVWLLDRRLMHQLPDARLHGLLTTQLVATTRQGLVDSTMLKSSRSSETKVEGLLRSELAVVARYLASSGSLVLHLSLFNNRVMLKAAPPHTDRSRREWGS